MCVIFAVSIILYSIFTSVVKKLPPWFPGASFIKNARLHRTLAPKAVNMPFEHVKKNMAGSSCYGVQYYTESFSGGWDSRAICGV